MSAGEARGKMHIVRKSMKEALRRGRLPVACAVLSLVAWRTAAAAGPQGAPTRPDELDSASKNERAKFFTTS